MSLPLEKATYRALASSAPIAFGKSSKGNKQIAVTFDVLGRHEETGDEVSTGESITWIGHFTDRTIDRTIESLLHAGWQGDDPAELSGVAGSSVLPTVVELVCEPEEYDGNWTLKVQWVNKPGAGRFTFKESIEESELRAFGAQMRSKVQSIRASGGAPRARTSAPNGSRDSGPRQSGSRAGYGHPNAPGNNGSNTYGGGRPDDDIPF
jgi:hypothetical protein